MTLRCLILGHDYSGTLCQRCGATRKHPWSNGDGKQWRPRIVEKTALDRHFEEEAKKKVRRISA